ncbi:MAG TPA: SDR family oxidoreductase [Rhodospirillaceae bacterium]|nr:SDR family oxidoreductase [Rhodospirillaceae bacterium]
MDRHLFCFGFGYTAQALARRLLAEGWRVSGTVRAPLERADVRLFPFDRTRPLPAGALDGVTHLLTSVPPDQLGDPVLDAAGAAILAAQGSLAWIGYLSTTGVYGDWRGAWVDESSPLRPSSDRAWRRVAAESAWLDLWRRHGLAVHVFRLAGIYGPGRSVLDEIRAGTARRIVKWGQVFSRIHVEDAAVVLAASMAAPVPGAIYNVCDDEAARPQDVVAFACDLLGVAAPAETPFEQAALSPMAQTFWADNKRVRNDRIRNDLGVRLSYPSYRQGLLAC